MLEKLSEGEEPPLAMLTYHNLTAEGIYISLDLPLLPEIIILCIVMAIWVFSIMQFIRYRGIAIVMSTSCLSFITHHIIGRYWSEWLLPAPSCEPFYPFQTESM